MSIPEILHLWSKQNEAPWVIRFDYLKTDLREDFESNIYAHG